MSDTELLDAPRGHWRLVVTTDEQGLRLDQFLARHCPLSRGVARRVIDLGGVSVAGQRVRSCSRAVRSGETIAVHCDGNSLTPFRLAATHILYQDRDLLVVNKPAGIETQPTPARYQGTLYEALQRYLLDPHRPHVQPSLGMVQRLDRDTSGVILFSTSTRAHKRVTEQMASRQTVKRYLALVEGAPPTAQDEIRSELARCRDNRVRSVSKGGQEAITRYRTRLVLSGATLLEVELVTGRMHQIRAHMAEAGCPLLGDSRYGGSMHIAGLAVARHMLHAWSLELQHPVTDNPLRLIAPLANDMCSLIKQLHPDAGCLAELECCR